MGCCQLEFQVKQSYIPVTRPVLLVSNCMHDVRDLCLDIIQLSFRKRSCFIRLQSAGVFSKMQLMQRTATSGRVAARSRTQTVRVQTKVTKSPSDPRVVRGTCYVTKDVRVVAAAVAVAVGPEMVFVSDTC